jgi:alanine racemase
MNHSPLVVVDLSVISANIAVMSQRVAPAEVMVVVKSNGYGHGLIPAATAAMESGCNWIGVHEVAAGLAIRHDARFDDVRLFAWQIAPREELRAAIVAGIDIGVSTVGELNEVAASCDGRVARVHLKIDTGLHRAGAREDEWEQLVGAALSMPERIQVVGIWSHLAETSDELDLVATQRFNSAVAIARSLGVGEVIRHTAASGPAYRQAATRFDLVRIGAFAYGIPPGDGVSAHDLGLRTAMTVSAPVLAVDSDSVTVGIGYGHGILSAAAGKAELAINGRRHLICEVGPVTLQVRAADEIAVGDTAYLFGDGDHGEPSLLEWAERVGTISEEFTVRMTPALRREYWP